MASYVGVQASRGAMFYNARQAKAQASRWQVFQETSARRRVHGTYVEKPIIFLLYSNFITIDYNLWYFSLTSFLATPGLTPLDFHVYYLCSFWFLRYLVSLGKCIQTLWLGFDILYSINVITKYPYEYI